MNKIISFILSSLFLLSTITIGSALTYDEVYYERPSEMFRLINEERLEEGVNALKYNTELERLAKIRAEEIYSVYSDERPNGSMFWTLLDESGLKYKSCEENIGTNTVSAAHMVDIWMLYDACRDNILSTKYTDMGAAMVKDDIGAKYWVVIFCEGLGSNDSSIDSPTDPEETPLPNHNGNTSVPIEDEDAIGSDLPNISDIFTDVQEDAWYYNYVRYVYARGIMVGTGNNTFGVNVPLTRAMLVTVLYKLEDSPEVISSTPFTDVPNGSWYGNSVRWAYEQGITSGISKTAFGPNNKITREQLVTLIYNYATLKGRDVSIQNNLDEFTDQKSISSWARTSMSWATGSGIINGVGNNRLDPKGNATRAQVATILFKYLEPTK